MSEVEFDNLERKLSDLHTEWLLAGIKAQEAERAYLDAREKFHKALKDKIQESMRQQ